jgi:HPt (histidine-containing phosphotransfer) domain-containing protein
MEMYDITLKEFYDELQNKINDLSEYKDNNNMDDYAILAHALKTEARYVGCNELGDIAYEHEIAGKENNSEFVNEKFEQLKNEANRVYEVIKKYLGE